jgi:hypothetical protein
MVIGGIGYRWWVRGAVTAMLLALPVGAQGADKHCPAQQGALHDVCVDQAIINFVACLRETSNGVITTKVYNKTSTTSGAGVKADLGIRLISKGVDAGVDVDNKQFSDVVTSAVSTFGSEIPQHCKELARLRSRPSSPSRPKVNPSAPKTAPPVSPPTPSQTAVIPVDAEAAAIDELMRQGAEHSANGRVDFAIYAYQQAHDKSGRKNPEAAGHLGFLKRNRSDYPSALYYLRNALDNLDHPWVKSNRTQLEDALEDVKTKIASPPAQPDRGAGKRTEAPPPDTARTPIVAVTRSQIEVNAPTSSALYHRWWFWTAVGGFVAAGAATAFLIVNESPNYPTPTMGTYRAN